MRRYIVLFLLLGAVLYAEKPEDWIEPQEIKTILTEQGALAGHPPGLAHCLAYSESRFNPLARSKPVDGYRSDGLTQIYRKYLYGPKGAIALYSSKTAATFDWRDPRDNAEVGCRYLAALRRQFGGSLYLALVAYNWGPTKLARIKTWEEIPIDVRDYADGIMKNLAEWDETW